MNLVLAALVRLFFFILFEALSIFLSFPIYSVQSKYELINNGGYRSAMWILLNSVKHAVKNNLTIP